MRRSRRERAARQLLRDALHVQDADDVVELAVVHGQARVRRLPQLVEQVFPVLVDVDARRSPAAGS